jgi:TfoX/Sxy family transcriptional regulator of competence genes
MNADDLAAAVRAALAGAGTIREVKMFGGIGFMLNGNLLAGASTRGLLVRVGKELEGGALKRPGVRPMEMRGRKMDGYIYVDPPALTTRAVKAWIEMASVFVRTLPRKSAGTKRKRKKATTKGRRR